jgi:sterol desaturase/sphingolipid hydroxylase (fatty acid hydroxylase superfamily)
MPDAAVRLLPFVGVLLVLAVLEALLPRRRPSAPKGKRWANNLALVALNTLAARVLLPAGAVGMALYVESRGWGLLPELGLPYWLAVALTVVALDFVIYLQHVLFHAVPALWRLHRVHHADLDFDASTGLRFHTIEIVISLGIKLAAVALLGPPALGVLLFEVLLNATAMFSHANLKLPVWLDRALRLVVVTPDMHRVHHSADVRETDSNFGFNLPWWDYLLGTYRAQPAAGHEAMTVGLSEFRDERVLRLPWMLASPFAPDGRPEGAHLFPGRPRGGPAG